MSVNNLMITSVEDQYTAEYIANSFWRNNIAKVSKITLIPYLKNSEIRNVAYIVVSQWCESEAAYNFIQRLKQPEGEARIVHHDEDWFPVQLNTHNNGDLEVGNYTTIIPNQYYERVYNWESIECDDVSTAPCTEASDEEEILDEEEWAEFVAKRPIRGLSNDYYSIDEAFEHLWVLNQNWDYAESEEQRKKIEAEMQHFETELCIIDAEQRSANVTQRAYQFGSKKHMSEACSYCERQSCVC